MAEHLYGLVGHPLSHSFSKKYFTEKFLHQGRVDCAYELFDIDSISKLPQIIAAHSSLRGLNVTIPYKKEVFPFLDAHHLPKGILACNCIRIKDGRLTGYNTDVIGFEKSFAPLLQPHHTKALVLGTGGASEAVAYVLRKLAIPFTPVSRTCNNDDCLQYEQLTKSIMEEYSIIINTTPVGTYPQVEACPAIPYQFVTPAHYLYDLVYNPVKTLFLQRGEAAGATIKNGYDMLVIQAEESWKIWNA